AATQDSKTALQEWAHAHSGATPVYTVTERIGPDHDPTFAVSVTIDGTEQGAGKGRSKRVAEQQAARAVLLAQGVWKDEA
ncbi:MAG: putative dsRNA-binding protein, partial [Pseudomonadota bacterium]